MQTIEELFLEEIQDLYDAEKQLLRALPNMAKASADPKLEALFSKHTQETEGQVKRLEQIFESMGKKSKGRPCLGMKGLVEEGREVIGEKGPEPLHDAAIAGAAQRVEHYEMAGYMAARELAEMLGNKKAVQLLDRTLNEETLTDQRLAKVSKSILSQVMKEEGRGNGRAKAAANGAKTKSRGRSNQSSNREIGALDENELL